MKKNLKALYLLIRKDLQDVLLSEKSKVLNSVYVTFV